MASIKEEIAAIAADHGYTGPKPKSTAGAIDALADTLAGTDVKSGRSIAGAIKALAPYIGSGGGGAELGTLVGGGNGYLFGLSSLPYEGSYLDDSDMTFSRLLFGQQVVASVGDSTFNIPMIAAGITICKKLNGLSPTMYRGTCTDDDGSFMCDSVEEFADYTIADDELRFVIPELEENEFLAYKLDLDQPRALFAFCDALTPRGVGAFFAYNCAGRQLAACGVSIADRPRPARCVGRGVFCYPVIGIAPEALG